MKIEAITSLIIAQRRELVELLGFEARNKYEIKTLEGQSFGFCAEQRRGILGALLRMVLGHWRSFELHFFSADRQLTLRAVHPFRFFFQRLEVFRPDGQLIGSVQQRFGIFRKAFDLEDEHGRVILRMESGFLSFWTFPILRGRAEVATVQKRWSGLLKEMFTDTDNFQITFSPSLSLQERWLVLACGVFVDLQYFEKKAGS